MWQEKPPVPCVQIAEPLGAASWVEPLENRHTGKYQTVQPLRDHPAGLELMRKESSEEAVAISEGILMQRWGSLCRNES